MDGSPGQPAFVLDVTSGRPEGFSLGTVDGGHFVTRSTACPLPDRTR
nr:DUF779 domain-containing protein [Actinomycetales bacterium]